MSDTKYWVGFTLIPGVGWAKFSRLEQHFGGLERAWQASAAELQAAGLDERTVQAIVARRPKISLDAEMERLERYKTDTESLILSCLSPEPTHIDEVGLKCSLPIPTVSSTLAMMELKGAVKQVGGMNYILARETREEYRVRVE
jgi:predicted Rossmann fold nucleotide-binding protein DprA/Smf involved in DNA uptake